MISIFSLESRAIMSKPDETPTTKPEEIEALIQKLKDGKLDQKDTQLIERLLRTFLSLISVLQKKNQSISKLKRMLFGPKTDKRSIDAKDKDSSSGRESSDGETGTNSTKDESQMQASDEQKKRKGHGRRARSEYVGADVVSCPHTELKIGDACPDSLCHGHLYDTQDPSVLIQLEGQPPVSATQYEQQVLRCSSCQARYTASLPEDVEAVKYLPSCDVACAMWKYSAGVPFTRLGKVQSSFGTPLSASVQYERCETVASAVLPIYLHLRKIAAQGKVFYSDDTRVKILSLMKENKSLGPDDRRGMQTTAIVSELDDKKIALYASGRRHCGENIFELMKERESGLQVPIQMADPLSANWSVKFERHEAKCLAHARRQFIEIESNFPQECSRVLKAIASVYEVEAETLGMSDLQRLVHHQEKSFPVMTKLREWIEDQINGKRVEPVSSLGKACAYTLRHWKELTQFLVLEGCPLDNNQAERALKLAVLNRKNSLFYKTENGAAVGDVLMSLIKSCELNEVKAWDYLVELMRNRERLRREPEAWLPWNYRLKLDEMKLEKTGMVHVEESQEALAA